MSTHENIFPSESCAEVLAETEVSVPELFQKAGLTMAAEPPMEFTAKNEKQKNTEIFLKDEGMSNLLNRSIPEPEYILKPWLCTGESALVSAKAGVGKTFFGMEIAKAITLTGNAFNGRWPAPTARRIVYLDGEMGAAAMKSRGRMMNLDTELFFYVDALNQDETTSINLADPRFQDTVMRLIKFREADVLFIDNLATLYHPGENPNSTLYTDALNRFILQLRKERIAVVIIDHEGKGTTGGPRGTSAKTDIAHVAITLERPESASPADGAHFIVRFTKKRGFHGESASPFVANLCDGEWEVSEVPESGGGGSKPESPKKEREIKAYRILDEGGDMNQIKDELNVSHTTAWRYETAWKKKNGFDSPETITEFDAFAG